MITLNRDTFALNVVRCHPTWSRQPTHLNYRCHIYKYLELINPKIWYIQYIDIWHMIITIIIIIIIALILLHTTSNQSYVATTQQMWTSTTTKWWRTESGRNLWICKQTKNSKCLLRRNCVDVNKVYWERCTQCFDLQKVSLFFGWENNFWLKVNRNEKMK